MISGALLMGHGDKMDAAAAKPLVAGGVAATVTGAPTAALSAASVPGELGLMDSSRLKKRIVSTIVLASRNPSNA